MNILQRSLQGIDNYQRRHRLPGFLYAVVKKYGEDNGGYQAAIITYYGVLSLFPLLLVFTTVSQLVLRSDANLRFRIANSIARYFPIIGTQLEGAVHSPHKVGVALALSLLVAFYGARGGASALQFSINSLWHIPPTKQPPFLQSASRSFGIILVGGIGFVVTSLLVGYTSLLGRSFDIRLLSTVISALILWGTFIVIFKLATAGNKQVRNVLISSAMAAVSIQILQTAGGVILAHEMRSLKTTNGTFTLVIALLFWIYIQAEVILYSIETDIVREKRLFPRSLQGTLTAGDKQAYSSYAHSFIRHPSEQVAVHFDE